MDKELAKCFKLFETCKTSDEIKKVIDSFSEETGNWWFSELPKVYIVYHSTIDYENWDSKIQIMKSSF